MIVEGSSVPDRAMRSRRGGADEVEMAERDEVVLTGRLVCNDDEEVGLVERHLARHVALTRAESGCLHFEVERTDDPRVWRVAERFVDRAAFDAHRTRVESSEWGRVTAGIQRDYVIGQDSGQDRGPNTGTAETRALLRSLPTLTGAAPTVDPATAEAGPVEMFLAWLDVARRAGVPEPHAMTLSTVDAGGVPDARVLVLKDLDERGWAFASTRSSVKGEHLAAQPHAALTFWWQPLVRSVRVRGRVVEASREESSADLRARSASARDGVDPDDWTLWRVVADRVEFWQGSQDRRHTRIVFVRDASGWHREA